VETLQSTSWAANNTSSVAGLLPPGGAFFDQSSGTEMLPDGSINPNFQIIKKVFQLVKRRIHLGTGGALTGSEFVAVMGPTVAQAFSIAGEIVNAIKQQPGAVQLTDPNLDDWSIPLTYGGFKLVVEDTVRTYRRMHADGSVADVTQPSQRDYILNTDTIYFLSRPGGLDGKYGYKNFSTVQIYIYDGEALVMGETDAWNQVDKGRISIEDEIVVPANYSGFALTNCLSTGGGTPSTV
jgi:hypothetical protein